MIAKAAHSARRRRRSDHDGNLSAASGEDAANLCVGYFSLALVQQHRCSLTPLLFRQIRSLGPVRIPTMLFRFGCTRMGRERERRAAARPDGSLFLARARRQHTLPARSITTFLTYLTPIAPVHSGMQQLAYQTGRRRLEWEACRTQHVHFNPLDLKD
jgi:hypothetical protein